MERETKDPILNVLPTLRKQHPLRQQADAVLLDPQVPIQKLEPVLRALTSAFRLRRNEPIVASWLIAHANWSDDQRSTLSEKLSIKVEKAMKGKRIDRSLLRLFLRFIVVSAAFCFTLFMCDPLRGLYHISGGIVECGYISIKVAIPLTLLGSVASLPLSLWILERRRTQLFAAIAALVELGQPACMASLAMAMVHGYVMLHADLWDAAASALERVMSNLRPDDLGTLPGRTVPALCSALTARSREMTLGILQALTLIGDGRAIHDVGSLSRNHYCPDVREAATKLLPILQQRNVEHKSSALLLRASNAPADSKQSLLRPSWEQPATDSSQLLRMTNPERREEQDRRL